MRSLRPLVEHVEAVLARVAPLAAVRVPLETAAVEAPGLVLAADVVAAAPVPAFDHAAVDGYALRSADLPPRESVSLRVVGGVAAGQTASRALSAGEAARVMTGAPLPPGADVVVPVEHTSTGRFVPGRDGAENAVTLARPRKDNIRRRGEDVAAGLVLATAGDDVTPALVAAAAAAGVRDLAVHRRPRVAVISTGSELRPAGAAPGPAGVVDSNSLMLAAIVRRAGGVPVRRGGVPDDAASLRAALDDVVGEVDLIVTTGGVSAGAWDVVRQVLTEGGTATDADLTGVAMRPGRPQALAAWRDVPWVALPGTPTAAFVAAHLFVLPAVDRLRGARRPGLPRTRLRAVAGPWGSGKQRSEPEPHGPATPRTPRTPRTHVVPVRVARDGVAPAVGAVGGHSLVALLGADGLALAPAGGVRPGDELEVVLLGGAR
ncbi:gephyrin-like molybdotransferase Glp [Xylanimonas sp. McL0601]|uniref:molybdopterin molybdotransferase MoeA n=1 Tax=Xylanimonas sp. McL0601 TaxID=3414739 RepID=UPI003CF8A4A6